MGRPLDDDDFTRAINLNLSMFGGNKSTMAYAFEHEILGDPDGYSPTQLRSVTALSREIWPKSGNTVEIPYLISKTFANATRTIISWGMREFHEKTCIRQVL